MGFTKAELLDEANRRGLELSSTMTKAEIQQALQDDGMVFEGDPVGSDFCTPVESITAVSGRDQMTEDQRAAVIDSAARGGAADQGSLGGTGGTTVEGLGEGGGGGAGGGTTGLAGTTGGTAAGPAT